MSLFSSIKALFGGSGPRPAGQRRYVVDGVDLLGAREGRLFPREMIGLLHRLSRFATKEKIGLQVVFEGEPLRRAGDGDEFNGITVHYAKDRAARPGFLLDLARKELRQAGAVTVIASGADLEKQILAAGAQPLRPATFRKALDAALGDDRGGGGGRGGDGRGGGGGDRGRRRPFDRPRGPRPEGGGGPAQPPPQDAPPAGDKPQGGDPVRDLLDVVE
jgi:hypothetical protein